MLKFTNMDVAGMLPHFFNNDDDRCARQQLHESYAHGGGVWPFVGFDLHNADQVGKAYLQYPDDPPMREMSRATLHPTLGDTSDTDPAEETLILFEGSWLAIVDSEGDYTVTRVD